MAFLSNLVTAPLSTLVVLTVALCMTGCSKPSAVNIALRKENQALDDRLVSLERQHFADQASMAAMRGEIGTTNPAVVDPSRLPDLFTTIELSIGRLTGPASLSSTQPTVMNGLKVQVAPRDDTGDVIKASGTLIVEATDPNQSPEPLLGRWVFEPADLKTKWVSSTFVYAYVLLCPWEGPLPDVKSVRVKVRFTDFLTGRSIGPVDRVVQLKE